MSHRAVDETSRAHARTLRQQMTKPEVLLWRHLKAHRSGTHFRRQSPIGPYIVDFVSHAARLVVEIDGASQNSDHAQRRDSARDAWLASRGYRVARFSNAEVLSNLEGVWLAICDLADAGRGSPLSPTLTRKGGGSANLPRPLQRSKDDSDEEAFPC